MDGLETALIVLKQSLDASMDTFQEKTAGPAAACQKNETLMQVRVL